MDDSLSFNTNIRELVNQKKLFLPIFLTFGFLLFLTLLVIYGIVAEGFLIVFGIIAAIPILVLTIKYPKFWIFTIALSNIIFFNDRGQEVTVIETIVIIEYIASLFIWFFWKIFVTKEKLIENIADISVLFFSVFIIFNIFLSLLNDIDILLWSREAINLLLILFYFPIKKYFTKKKDLVILLTIYLFVVTITAFNNFYTYATALTSDIQYAYELAMGIRVNQTLFTSASLFGFIFALHQKSKLKSILLLAFTVISVGGLITSFSRTFWVFLVAGLIISFFYFTPKQRMKLVLYSLIVSTLLIFSALFLFQNKAKIVLVLIEKRFTSTSEGTQDVSVQSRFDEYAAVWKNIEKYPMGGTGLASEFIFYNFLNQQTSRTTFVHNGYLFIMMKLGIPLTLVCFFPYLFFIIKGEKYARKTNDEFYRLLSLGAYLSVILMIVSNFTAAQIIQRESSITTALSFAFISIVLNKFEKKEKLLNANN